MKKRDDPATLATALEKKTRAADVVRKSLIYLLLTVWAIAVIFPFYWMILTSFKSYSAYSDELVPKFFTLTPTGENYGTAFSAVPLAKYFLNTLLFTVATTLIMLAVSILAAFAFARLEFRGVFCRGDVVGQGCPRAVGGNGLETLSPESGYP